MPGELRRSLTSSHRPAPMSDCSTRSRRLCAAPGGQAQARGHVVEDRHRGERVGLLEDHPDGASHGHDVDLVGVDVDVVEGDRALGAGSGDLLVHAVQAAQHG